MILLTHIFPYDFLFLFIATYLPLFIYINYFLIEEEKDEMTLLAQMKLISAYADVCSRVFGAWLLPGAASSARSRLNVFQPLRSAEHSGSMVKGGGSGPVS